MGRDFAPWRLVLLSLLSTAALALGAALALAPGCNQIGETPDAPTPDEIVRPLAEAVCDLGGKCCSEAGVLLPPDTAGCVDQVMRNLAGAGLPEPFAMEVCVAAARSLGCASSLRALFTRERGARPAGACVGAFTGKVPLGGECAHDVVCAGGGVCVAGTCRAEVDCGDAGCAAQKGEGEPCSSDEECAGDRCLSPALTCGPKLGVGAFCFTNGDCQDGYCDDAHTCVSKLAAGASCAADAWCGAGLFCKPVSADASVCAPTGDIGATCQGGAWCKSRRCDPGTSMCALKLGDGKACVEDDDCSSGVCSWLDMRCAPRGGLGAPCIFSYECDPKHYCPDGVCAPRGPDGAPCGFGPVDPGEECVSGVCRAAVGQARCAPADVCHSF